MIISKNTNFIVFFYLLYQNLLKICLKPNKELIDKSLKICQVVFICLSKSLTQTTLLTHTLLKMY